MSFVNRVLEVKSKGEMLASCCLRPYSSAEGCKEVPAWGNSLELWFLLPSLRVYLYTVFQKSMSVRDEVVEERNWWEASLEERGSKV